MARRCSFVGAFLWAVVTALAILLPLPAASAALSRDAQILLSCANQTKSKTSYMRTWNASDGNPCGWRGVLCGSDSTVVRLDFSSWSLEYINLSTVSSLKSLRELDLSSNPGAKFLGLETLTGLRSLDVSNTWIFGDDLNITSANLWYLYADRCVFYSGMPSLQGLSNLRVLSLSGINLMGALPEQLCNLINLEFLDLSYNQLSGGVPDLKGLKSLTHLILTGNKLTGIMTAPPKLQYLSAGENSFTNLTPLFFLTSTLRHVNMSWNRLEGPLAPWHPSVSVPELQWLDLSRNRLTGSIPWGFKDLIYLNLLNNNLSGAIPPDIGMNAVVAGDSLDLSGNELGGRIPEGLLPRYHTVNLSRNLLHGNIPNDLCNRSGCEKYHSMDLSDNKLEGPLPSFLLNLLSGYGTLWLQNNKLSGDISRLLPQMLPLKSIRLQGNLFTGDLTTFFTSFYIHYVMELDLSYNRFSMTHAKEKPNPLQAIFYFDGKASHSTLKTLRLAGNNLMGLALPELSDPSDLEILDLAACNLSGVIPDSLHSSFPKLRTFNVSGNNLSGPIPDSLLSFELAQLRDFDFSNNNLSGPIPPSLGSVAIADRFVNNPELCGPPLGPCPHSGHHMLAALSTVFIGVVLLSSTFCVLFAYQWRKQHQQDKDLIATLLDRENVLLMSLRQLRTATGNFSGSSQIGVGGFGIVYAGQLRDGTAVAIKKSKRMGSPLDKQQFLNEVRILSQVNHRHLVRLLGCCLENKIALLVFEYVPNGTLQEHLQGKRGDIRCRLTWRQRLHIALETSDALDYLHSATQHPIFHRDVKSANILLDQNLNAKVADFGMSKLVPKWATHVSTLAIQGTLGYIDPEYYTSLQLTSKSDVYSFGAVLLELISAKSPVKDKGDWGTFIDPVLLDTLDSPAGRASIENMAILAAKCLSCQMPTTSDRSFGVSRLRSASIIDIPVS